MLSQALTELLDSAGSPDQAANEIASYFAFREEARAALPALKAVAEHRAGEDGVKAVIGRRFSLYPQPERDDGEWAAWWADYYDVLEDVPLACLEAGMRVWIARPGSQFMPKPGELRDLAFRTPSKTLQRYQRAKRALQIADNPQALRALSTEVPEGVAIDTAAEVKRMLEEFKAKAGERSGTIYPKPTFTPGKTDERGITQEMRDLIARRAAKRPNQPTT